MSELVAITGGAGFIGSHLAEGLLKAGYAVRILDNLTTGSLDNLIRIQHRADFQELDIRDLRSLEQAFRGVSIVLHHAGISSVPRSFSDVTYTHEVNVTGTLNVLNAAVRASVRKVINASSSSVYGNNGAEFQIEDAAPSPLSPYALSKWMGELYTGLFARTTQLETLSVRYFNVFGPRQRFATDHAAVIPLFIRNVAEGGNPTIFGDGEQTRDFTFVADAVEAILRAARSQIPSGAVLNVATGTSLSLNELVHLLSEILGSYIVPVYRPERQGDVRHSRAGTARSKHLLGDYVLTDLREGLVQTARWILDSTGIQARPK
jgi:nucleoside-diphosphate-sugar epimerase